MSVNFDLKDQETQKKVLIALCGLVIIVLYFIFLLKPALAGLGEVNPNLAELKENIDRAEQWIAKKQGLEKQLKELQSRIEGYKMSSSEEEIVPAILEELSSMAHDSEVDIVGIKSTEFRLEEADGQAVILLKEIPITIKARCGYHHLGDFISKLESAKRVFAVRDIIIAARPQSPRSHDVKLLVSTFFISED